MPAPQVDRRVARSAIAVSPVVGVVLGFLALGVLRGLLALGCPALVAALVLVGLLALVTRGMHVDGLADTADGLGCYGPPERALAVMKDGGAGPFAVVTLIVVLGIQVAGVAYADQWVVPLAVTAGRAAFPLCCRQGVPAARQSGLGALVASSQPVWVPVAWWVLLAGAGVFAVPGRWWQGVVAIAAAGAVVLLLSVHTRRRFGGVTGDVLGAASELAVATVLFVGSFS